jgi:hypothetical protein
LIEDVKNILFSEDLIENVKKKIENVKNILFSDDLIENLKNICSQMTRREMLRYPVVRRPDLTHTT